jgi:hypothetical protein
MMTRPNELLSWGVLRRTPRTPRSLRGSESRSARRSYLGLLDVVLGEIDR